MKHNGRDPLRILIINVTYRFGFAEHFVVLGCATIDVILQDVINQPFNRFCISAQLGRSTLSPFCLNRPNKFFGPHSSSQPTSFERKIFSRHFLFLFDAKKKEPFGGGEPRRDRGVWQRN
jgi:hypothetical protein